MSAKMPRYGGAWLGFDGDQERLPTRDIDALTVIGFAWELLRTEE